MKVGVPKETFPGERRVALVPESVAALAKVGHSVVVELGAGVSAGLPDEMYREKGATLGDRTTVFRDADVVVQVRGPGANPHSGGADLALVRADQWLIGMQEPFFAAQTVAELAKRRAKVFSLELIPRITRAQSMDVLSSMATIAGYKAVLLAAGTLPRMFPMFMTAAGTLTPAHVFVIGAGVAGLQAIATAKRLGAVVKAYDVRPAVKEQVESVGAKFVEMKLDTAGAEGKGGYAKEMDAEFIRKQRELMTSVVAESQVVITTAAIPGKKSPVLITADMVKAMAPGSVIVDLAAERGGNCELTRADETVDVNGVTILGPTNLPGTVPFHASQMYSRNVVTFLKELTNKEGKSALDMNNEVHRDTLLTSDGDVVHVRIREALGLTATASKA